MQQAKHTGKVIIDMRQHPMIAQSHDYLIAIRNNNRWVARLQPIEQEALEPYRIEQDAQYLIIGGLGGLGYLLLRNLIDRGARHISLCARSVPTPDLLQKLDMLRQSKVQIEVSQVDILDASTTAAWMKQVNQDRPVKGILFLAGQLSDGLIENVNWMQFEKALNVKTQGLLNVDLESRKLDLEFFIAFSSLASITGSPGQASYVAANTFMDHLMQSRAKQGLPSQSINWGPWEEAGMAQRLNAVQAKRLLDLGIAPLPTAQALQIFNSLGRDSRPQIVVATINWPQFLKNFPKASLNSIYAAFKQPEIAAEKSQSQTQAPSANQIVWREVLSAIESGQRAQHLIVLLTSAINKVIGADEHEPIELRKPLFDLGLDSLTAVELKNRLETNFMCSLSTTLLFDYPTLEALSEHLKKNMADLFSTPGSHSEDLAATSNTAATDEFDDLSQDDLEMLLASKLKK
jgi:acyl carrier protein/NAD(P)-dependent dehydrogenase (short-subunit alcohol dehydrogenase family)